jgi:hypothetical protein
MGWTINFARPGAIPVLLGIIALLIVPSAIVRASGGGTAIVSITGVASILAVVLLSAYLSSTKRWSHRRLTMRCSERPPRHPFERCGKL